MMGKRRTGRLSSRSRFARLPTLPSVYAIQGRQLHMELLAKPLYQQVKALEWSLTQPRRRRLEVQATYWRKKSLQRVPELSAKHSSLLWCRR